MYNLIKNIEIRNFKSIKNVKLDDCNRINLLIGRPNVGKSNFLEALSFFTLPYSKQSLSNKLTDYIRLENIPELFFDGNIEQKIEIITNIAKCEVNYTSSSDKNNLLNVKINNLKSRDELQLSIDDKMKIKFESKIEISDLIKKYSFNINFKPKNSNLSFLLPPYGVNLLNILSANKDLKTDLSDIFNEYGLELVFDKASQSIKIIKRRKGKELFLIPYTSVADTLQRIIFFKSAIVSNTNSILLFEEPEAHSFPPYIVHITHQIINTRSNQYFISTHSPFIVNDFLEHSRDELSIFMFDYKKGETLIRKLNEVEIYDIYQLGIDLFSNNESFLK